MQVPIFKNFVGWRPKKVPKVPFFWLRGNTGWWNDGLIVVIPINILFCTTVLVLWTDLL